LAGRAIVFKTALGLDLLTTKRVHLPNVNQMSNENAQIVKERLPNTTFDRHSWIRFHHQLQDVLVVAKFQSTEKS
jgi:hypothetical protein